MHGKAHDKLAAAERRIGELTDAVSKKDRELASAKKEIQTLRSRLASGGGGGDDYDSASDNNSTINSNSNSNKARTPAAAAVPRGGPKKAAPAASGSSNNSNNGGGWNFDTDTSGGFGGSSSYSDPYGDQPADDGGWNAPAPAPARVSNSRSGRGASNSRSTVGRGGGRGGSSSGGGVGGVGGGGRNSSQQQQQQQQQSPPPQLQNNAGPAAAWEDVPIVKGDSNAQIEAEARQAAAATTQCPTCGRTFNDKAFAKHRGPCAKNAGKPVKVFNAAVRACVATRCCPGFLCGASSTVAATRAS